MAKKEALRDLQSRLAERMVAVRTAKPQRTWLAVDCAGQGVLFPLQQAGEIFDAPEIVLVPHAKSWLAGVANLRGSLYAVVDLASFLGLRERRPTERAPGQGFVPQRQHERVVHAHPRRGPAAVGVERRNRAGQRAADACSRRSARGRVSRAS